jgi:hypothetical protein
MLFHNVCTKKCILYPDLQETHRYENRGKKKCVKKEKKYICGHEARFYETQNDSTKACEYIFFF